MSSRQFKRRQFRKRILWIALTAWPLPFIKLRFRHSYSYSHDKIGRARHGSCSFDSSRFSFERSERKAKENDYEKSAGEIPNPRKEFNTFRKLLVKHGYFTAVSGLMVDY